MKIDRSGIYQMTRETNTLLLPAIEPIEDSDAGDKEIRGEQTV